MQNLKGQVALITGGSRGIGQAISEQLASDGASIVIGYFSGDGPRQAEDVTGKIKAAGGQAISVPLDVSKEHEVEDLFAKAIAAFGGIDIVVNNAGGGFFGPILETTEENFDATYALNVKSVFFGLKAAGRLINDHGRIINISSGTVATPSAGQGIYASSKAAVRTLTEVASMEFGARGIRVNSVMPGLIQTQLTADLPKDVWDQDLAVTAMGRHGKPDDIAGVVAFLASEHSKWVTGQHILTNGGLLR